MFLYDKPIVETELVLQTEEVESVCFMDYHVCMEKMKDGTLQHCIYMEEFETLGKKLGLL